MHQHDGHSLGVAQEHGHPQRVDQSRNIGPQDIGEHVLAPHVATCREGDQDAEGDRDRHSDDGNDQAQQEHHGRAVDQARGPAKTGLLQVKPWQRLIEQAEAERDQAYADGEQSPLRQD